jgi:hypothetical protein
VGEDFEDEFVGDKGHCSGDEVRPESKMFEFFGIGVFLAESAYSAAQIQAPIAEVHVYSSLFMVIAQKQPERTSD